MLSFNVVIAVRLLMQLFFVEFVTRVGVEDTRLEAKAKDTKKFRGQGPRTLAQVFSKKKEGLQKFFSSDFKKKGLQNFFSGEKGLQKNSFFRQFPLEENKKKSS